MATKEPVLLVVLIETAALRWFIAGISLQGEPVPLMRSAAGNLSPYIGQGFDEQVSFLRHRLSGVLQRGCDRLWGRGKKPCQIVFVNDAPFQQASLELTQSVAEHFAIWMTSPPVVYYVSQDGFPENTTPRLNKVAGDIAEGHSQALQTGLSQLASLRLQDDLWEEAPAKPGSSS